MAGQSVAPPSHREQRPNPQRRENAWGRNNADRDALMETVRQIREVINPRLEIEGLLRTMFDARNNLANEVSQQLLDHFGEKVYRTIIPRNIRLAEAPSFGAPIIKYDKTSRGSMAYLALAAELVRREREAEQAAELRAEA